MDTVSSTIQSSSTHSESSKTDSSKSGSGFEGIKKDRDFTKDNAASPIDLECDIQEERITKILNEAIYKVKLAVCLPRLIDEHILMGLLDADHMDDILFIYEQYDNPLFSDSVQNMTVTEEIQAGNLTLKNRLNPELGHLISLLMSYPQLEPIVEDMITEMKANYTSHVSVPSQPGLEYLYVLENFRSLIIRQMQTTAANELEEKIRIKKLEDSNEKLKADIKEYSDSLRTELEHFQKTMEQKVKLISELEQELVFLLHEANTKLKKKILDSDRQMVLATRVHALKYEVLKEEAVDCIDTYKSILTNHLIEEKSQRMRRFKVETQLMSWLQKYDTEMADKQQEYDEFEEKYKEELKLCEELDEKIAEQDKEYLPLMEEREEEYQQEMTNKMNAFKVEHAARVIQYCWREVLANRNEKRKLKKIQAKMRAAAEAASKKKKK